MKAPWKWGQLMILNDTVWVQSIVYWGCSRNAVQHHSTERSINFAFVMRENLISTRYLYKVGCILQWLEKVNHLWGSQQQMHHHFKKNISPMRTEERVKQIKPLHVKEVIFLFSNRKFCEPPPHLPSMTNGCEVVFWSKWSLGFSVEIVPIQD